MGHARKHGSVRVKALAEICHELVQPRVEHLARSRACGTRADIHESEWDHPSAVLVAGDATQIVMTPSPKVGMGLGVRLH